MSPANKTRAKVTALPKMAAPGSALYRTIPSPQM